MLHSIYRVIPAALSPWTFQRTNNEKCKLRLWNADGDVFHSRGIRFLGSFRRWSAALHCCMYTLCLHLVLLMLIEIHHSTVLLQSGEMPRGNGRWRHRCTTTLSIYSCVTLYLPLVCRMYRDLPAVNHFPRGIAEHRVDN